MFLRFLATACRFSCKYGVWCNCNMRWYNSAWVPRSGLKPTKIASQRIWWFVLKDSGICTLFKLLLSSSHAHVRQTMWWDSDKHLFISGQMYTGLPQHMPDHTVALFVTVFLSLNSNYGCIIRTYAQTLRQSNTCTNWIMVRREWTWHMLQCLHSLCVLIQDITSSFFGK